MIPVDINSVIQVDQQVVNFGKFISGKILGSTLMISNISDKEQSITISADPETEEYSCDEIFGPYLREELPFEYKDGAMIANSERKFTNWYIEDPVTKDLEKTLTIRMGP